MPMMSNIRKFSVNTNEAGKETGVVMDDLELEALNIQRRIDSAKEAIATGTEKGMGLSRHISLEVEEDKFIKMQRYEIFISKMEQLARAERKWKK